MAQTKWTNADGLNVRFGAKDFKEENAVPAQAVTSGTLQEVVYYITDATRLETTATFANGNLDERGVKLPNGAVIESAILYVDTAFTSGGSATLDIGTYRVDGTTATGGALAAGLVSARAVASLTAGSRFAGTGTHINAKLAVTAPTGRSDTGLFVAAKYNTAAFTAGTARVVITYRVPTNN